MCFCTPKRLYSGASQLVTESTEFFYTFCFKNPDTLKCRILFDELRKIHESLSEFSDNSVIVASRWAVASSCIQFDQYLDGRYSFGAAVIQLQQKLQSINNSVEFDFSSALRENDFGRLREIREKIDFLHPDSSSLRAKIMSSILQTVQSTTEAVTIEINKIDIKNYLRCEKRYRLDFSTISRYLVTIMRAKQNFPNLKLSRGFDELVTNFCFKVNALFSKSKKKLEKLHFVDDLTLLHSTESVIETFGTASLFDQKKLVGLREHNKELTILLEEKCDSEISRIKNDLDSLNKYKDIGNMRSGVQQTQPFTRNRSFWADIFQSFSEAMLFIDRLSPDCSGKYCILRKKLGSLDSIVTEGLASISIKACPLSHKEELKSKYPNLVSDSISKFSDWNMEFDVDVCRRLLEASETVLGVVPNQLSCILKPLFQDCKNFQDQVFSIREQEALQMSERGLLQELVIKYRDQNRNNPNGDQTYISKIKLNLSQKFQEAEAAIRSEKFSEVANLFNDLWGKSSSFFQMNQNEQSSRNWEIAISLRKQLSTVIDKFSLSFKDFLDNCFKETDATVNLGNWSLCFDGLKSLSSLQFSLIGDREQSSIAINTRGSKQPPLSCHPQSNQTTHQKSSFGHFASQQHSNWNYIIENLPRAFDRAVEAFENSKKAIYSLLHSLQSIDSQDNELQGLFRTLKRQFSGYSEASPFFNSMQTYANQSICKQVYLSFPVKVRDVEPLSSIARRIAAAIESWHEKVKERLLDNHLICSSSNAMDRYINRNTKSTLPLPLLPTLFFYTTLSFVWFKS